MNETIRDRMELLLAKIAGRDVDMKAMKPSIPANLEEKLMLEIADRADKIESLNGWVTLPTLKDLVDVDTNSVSDGQTITYDAKTEKWVSTDVLVPNIPNLDEIADVDITNPSNGHILSYNASREKWVNIPTLPLNTSIKSWTLFGVYTTSMPSSSLDINFDNEVSGDFEMFIEIINKTARSGSGSTVVTPLNDTSKLTFPLKLKDSVSDTSDTIAKFLFIRTGNAMFGYSCGPFDYQGMVGDPQPIYGDAYYPDLFNWHNSNNMTGLSISWDADVDAIVNVYVGQ